MSGLVDLELAIRDFYASHVRGWATDKGVSILNSVSLYSPVNSDANDCDFDELLFSEAVARVKLPPMAAAKIPEIEISNAARTATGLSLKIASGPI